MCKMRWKASFVHPIIQTENGIWLHVKHLIMRAYTLQWLCSSMMESCRRLQSLVFQRHSTMSRKKRNWNLPCFSDPSSIHPSSIHPSFTYAATSASQNLRSQGLRRALCFVWKYSYVNDETWDHHEYLWSSKNRNTAICCWFLTTE